MEWKLLVTVYKCCYQIRYCSGKFLYPEVKFPVKVLLNVMIQDNRLSVFEAEAFHTSSCDVLGWWDESAVSVNSLTMKQNFVSRHLQFIKTLNDCPCQTVSMRQTDLIIFQWFSSYIFSWHFNFCLMLLFMNRLYRG